MCSLVIPISLENFFSQFCLFLVSGCLSVYYQVVSVVYVAFKQVFPRYVVCRHLLLLESYLHLLDSVLQKATWFFAAIVLVLTGRRPNDLYLLYHLHF